MAVPSGRLSHLHLVEQVLGDRVIEGQGTQGHRSAGKDHQRESVVGPPVEETPDDLLGHPETIGGFEIEGGHGTGDIQGHHEIDALGALEPPRQDLLGPRESHRERRQGERGEDSGHHRALRDPSGASEGRGHVGEGKSLPPPTEQPQRPASTSATAIEHQPPG